LGQGLHLLFRHVLTEDRMRAVKLDSAVEDRRHLEVAQLEAEVSGSGGSKLRRGGTGRRWLEQPRCPGQHGSATEGGEGGATADCGSMAGHDGSPCMACGRRRCPRKPRCRLVL